MAEICCEVAGGSERKGECGGGGWRFGGSGWWPRRRPQRGRRLEVDEEDAVRGPAPRYGVTSVCGRRRDMEDAVTARLGFIDGHHFGVFDGHGCSHVATSSWPRRRPLPQRARRLRTTRRGGRRDVMEKSYSRMDAEAVGSRETAGPAPTCKCDHVGSTAVVAVVGPRHLVVANCGDSRAVLSPRQSSGDEEAAGPCDGAGSESDDGESGEDRACAEAAILLTKLALARQTADNVSVVVVVKQTTPAAA